MNTFTNFLKNRLKNEKGYVIHNGAGRQKFALVYPNLYHVGMSNLGIHIIYDLLNSRSDTSCERFFLPDFKFLQMLEKSDSPILSTESQTPLFKFPLIGFSLSFEPDYFNFLKILQIGKIKLKSSESTKFDPILIAGGPCATFNPVPLQDFVDAFIIGEAEVVLPNFFDTFYLAKSQNLSRIEILKKLSEVEGVFVPKFKKIVRRQFLKNLDEFPAHTIIVTDDAEFNMYLIETARGCGRHCRFCMAGYCFRNPRNRSLEILREEILSAKKFNKKIGLMGAAISDYPQINEICKIIRENNLPMSVASFRADSVTEELVKLLAESGLKTLTIAPEAGSSKMRAVINKGIEEEHIFKTLELGISAGIKNFKLYFMIGLPFETFEDVDAIIELAKRIKKYMEIKKSNGKLTLSINPFIPKPFTPFQWSKMAEKKYLDESLKKIRKELKEKNIEIIAESTRETEIQGILSRGDEKIGEILLKSHEMGGIKKFKQAMKILDVDEKEYLYRERDKDEKFAWDFLDMGFSKKYLYEEYKKAEKMEKTLKCFENCKRCGVCK